MSRRIIIDDVNNIINTSSATGSDRTAIGNISSGVTQGDIIQAFKGTFLNELNTGDIILIRNSITVVDTQTELDIIAPNVKLLGNIILDSNQQNSATSILTNRLEINDPLVYFSKRIANGDVGLIFQYFNNTAGSSAQVGFIGFNAKDKKFRLYESTNRDITSITNDKVYLAREQFMDNVGGVFNPLNNEITYDFLGELQVKRIEAKTGYFHDGINVNNFSVGGDQFKINSIGAIDTSGNINVNNNILLDALTGNVIVGGNIDLTGNLNINNGKFLVFSRTGNTEIKGNLDLSGNLIISDIDGNTKMMVYSSSGNTIINGYLDLSGNLTIGNKKMVVNSTTGNTGIAGQLDISKNLVVNVDKFVVDYSTGDTGIAGQLDVSKNLVVNVDKFVVDYSTGDTGIAGQLDISKNLVVDQDKFVVDVSNSKVGINISSPIYELDVSGSIATQCAIIYDDDDYNGVFAHRNNRNNTDFALLQTSTGKTRINCKKGSGNIIFTHGSIDTKQEFDSDGNVIIQGNLFSYSDIRIKTNIDTIENALDKVTSLRGVTYNMIKDFKENPITARRHIGLIAQEVEAIIPEAVKEENGIKTVAYGNIVGILIQAIKELKEKFELFNKNKFDNVRLLKFIYLYHQFNFWKKNIKNNIFHIGSYIGIGTKEPISPLHVEGNITQTGESVCNLKTTIIDGSLRINFNNIKQINNNIEINLNNNSNFIIDISNNSNIIINDINVNSIGQIGEIYILKNISNNCSITFDSKMKFIINTKPIIINNSMSCIKYTILKTNLISCRFEIFD